MIALWSNPEFVRNVRAQLRPGRVAATACICAVISIATGFAMSHQFRSATGPYGWGSELFQIAVWAQALVLAAGGGIACINTIYREKEQNTFDYQRVTQLTPLELTMGKLFGAPVFTYFVSLCLMPVAIFGAVMGKHSASTLLLVYLVLLVGSVTIHLLALLISLLTVRGSHTAAILLLLVLLWATSIGIGSPRFFQLGPCGPFYAPQFTEWSRWEPASSIRAREAASGVSEPMDVFFGQRVHHIPVLVAIDLMFAGWFLLALVRNIKRDPNYYEIYSPLQALGFAMFTNLLFLAFFRWQSETPIDSQSLLLTLNMVVFFCVGLATLRNRERLRRILRSRENMGTSLLDVAWPAPLLIIGTLAAGLLVVFGISKGRDPGVEWNQDFALLRSLFFVAWIVRDVQYLQWMSLRRGKHSLATGMLFLGIFYVCVFILMAPLGIYTRPERTAFSAFFLPSPVYLLDRGAWAIRPAIWAAAFVAQWFMIAGFIWLQQKPIAELSSSASSSLPEPAPART